jgi:23S rRNA pseudouridine2605 synthase
MPDSAASSDIREGQRIAKVMARAGLCSRREAEAWVLAGRVNVNGEVLASPAYNVSETDDVRVDGEPLRERERTRLFLFHKPRGLVTTSRDPEGRATIFDALPPDLPRVVAVGRLDINTEGLILLTNDGGLARILELPATGWLRRYRVRAHGAVEQSALDALREGVSIEGVHYAGIEARLERQQGANVWLTMGLREGKNREIKRVLEHLGLSVNRLIRVSFGPFELGDLGEREVEETPTRVLRDQLGPKLMREAGVDFDAPIVERVSPPPPRTPAPPFKRPSREAPGRGRDEKREFKPRASRPESARGDERRQPREGRKEFAPRSRDRSSGPPPTAHEQLRGRQSERPEVSPRARSAPEPSHPQRRRKHVGKLRAEIAAEGEGPRKRIERSATADRKGRVVAVERILPSRQEQRRRDEATQKAQARRDEAAQKAETRRGRQRSGEGERRRDFAPRAAGDEARRSDFAPRPAGKRFEKSALGSVLGGARPPRGERPDRPPRDDKPQGERRGPPARGGKPGGKSGSKPRGKPGGRPDFKSGGKSGGKPGGSRPPRRP